MKPKEDELEVLFILGQHVIIDGPSPQNTPLAGAVAVFCDE